jgi:hypothetical protein
MDLVLLHIVLFHVYSQPPVSFCAACGCVWSCRSPPSPVPRPCRNRNGQSPLSLRLYEFCLWSSYPQQISLVSLFLSYRTTVSVAPQKRFAFDRSGCILSCLFPSPPSILLFFFLLLSPSCSLFSCSLSLFSFFSSSTESRYGEEI